MGRPNTGVYHVRRSSTALICSDGRALQQMIESIASICNGFPSMGDATLA